VDLEYPKYKWIQRVGIIGKQSTSLSFVKGSKETYVDLSFAKGNELVHGNSVRLLLLLGKTGDGFPAAAGLAREEIHRRKQQGVKYAQTLVSFNSFRVPMHVK
jgi:hypothetical protein